MEILPSCSHISIIVWLQHLDSNKMPGEKARWELHKNAACCFEQILEAAPYKTAVVRPLTSYLINHPSKTSKTCCALLKKDKLMSNVLLWTHTHGLTSVGRPAKTYIHQLCADTGCHQEDLPRAMTDRDGWQEIVKGISAVGTP